MIQFHIFPGGVKRIVTFSYDDGNRRDAWLVDLFNRYKVKGTFHLNAANYLKKTEDELSAIRRLYAGHEIACHTVHHGWLNKMPPATRVREVLEDRMVLEKLSGTPVVGMSYPSGAYNKETEACLAACGIVYSRTTNNGGFSIPEDFLAWHPTAHHSEAAPLIDDFMANLTSQWRDPLFYIWGHSHEFQTDADYAAMEDIVRRLSGSDQIWYATNFEIYSYVKALRSLIVSADETMLYNPSAIDVWVEKDKSEIIKIPAGTTVTL